jgi:hypothetical protein
MTPTKLEEGWFQDSTLVWMFGLGHSVVRGCSIFVAQEEF